MNLPANSYPYTQTADWGPIRRESEGEINRNGVCGEYRMKKIRGRTLRPKLEGRINKNHKAEYSG